MSSRTQEISRLLLLRETFKNNFNKQICIGLNWHINTDADGNIHIKHSTGGADIKLSAAGTIETRSSIKTAGGISINDAHRSHLPEYAFTETNLTHRELFDTVDNFMISDPADNISSIQYFDVSTNADTFVYTSKPATHDIINIGVSIDRANYDNNFMVIDPIGDAENVKVNGLAINHDGSVIAALLSLKYNGLYTTHLYFYTNIDSKWNVTTSLVVDMKTTHMTQQMMFSGNGKYLCVGLPTYNNSAGTILIYKKEASYKWIFADSITPISGVRAGFGSMAYISCDGQTVLSRPCLNGAADSRARVYVFEFSGTRWLQKNTIEDPNRAPNDNLFGIRACISTDGHTLFISDEQYSSNRGRIVTYRKNIKQESWCVSDSLSLDYGVAGDNFGNSMHTMGKYLVAITTERSAKYSLHVYGRFGNSWNLISSKQCDLIRPDGRFHVRLCHRGMIKLCQLESNAPTINRWVASHAMLDMPLQTTTFEPAVDNKYDIGSIDAPYRDIFVSDAINVKADMLEKRDVRDCMFGIDFIKKLRPVTYNWAYGDDRDHDGIIAQDVAEIIQSGGGIVDRSYKGIRYDELIAPLVMTIQHIDNELRILEN